MPVNHTTQQIKLLFRRFNKIHANNAFPNPSALSAMLNNEVDKAKASGNDEFHINEQGASYFATAAVEMWQRAVHSFLISASLTKASPIWSSVSGYYSSHYTIRAFAHLFGYFLLYRKNKCSVELNISAGSYTCKINTKSLDDSEHKFYWKKTKANSLLFDNSFYTINDRNLSISDSAHRNKANYHDHLDRFPQFQILDNETLKQRVNIISTMPLYDAPIPDADVYPDLESVQLIAYYRLANFRMILDDIIRPNKFWDVQRNPTWCPDYLKFQLANEELITAYKELL
jgi:hypothetical protein